MQRKLIVSVAVVFCLGLVASAATRKEYRFTVAPGANIYVDTQYGSIAVKPGAANQVIVTAVQQSDKVDVDSLQKANRIAIESHLRPGADAQSGRVDYELTVPPDAIVSLHSSTGPLTVEGMQGDLALEGAAASVDVHNVSHCHVHIKTISGPVSLRDVHEGHVEITSISGDIRLKAVSGPLVQVNSGSGKIYYDGDFGSGGDYSFVSHTGEIDALVPANASFDVHARSMRGTLENDFPFEPAPKIQAAPPTGSSFFGTVGKAASKVVLQSFSGKIRVKKR